MSLYVDSSALLKRYVDEPDSRQCEAVLLADPTWVTARHTLVETRRNLARLLDGNALSEARVDLARDWSRFHVVELDATTCDVAASIAEHTGCRSLDALHLAAATRVGGGGAISVLCYDIRMAQAARSLGFTVLGA